MRKLFYAARNTGHLIRAQLSSEADVSVEEVSASTPRGEIASAVASFQSGDDRDGNFRILYETFFPRLQRYFARKGFTPQECQDLTQDTMLGIYKGLDGYRSDSRFETWVYRVATSTSLKRFRAASTAKRAGREVPHDETIATEPAFETPAGQLEEVLTDERRREMRDAIQRLPEQMRKCLTLRLYHGLMYREIADVMKLKIDTVKAHLYKARNRLKEELRPYSLEDLDF